MMTLHTGLQPPSVKIPFLLLTCYILLSKVLENVFSPKPLPLKDGLQ